MEAAGWIFVGFALAILVDEIYYLLRDLGG